MEYISATGSIGRDSVSHAIIAMIIHAVNWAYKTVNKFMADFNNFQRYSALSASLPASSLFGKVFMVADNSDAWFERLQRFFPIDSDGEVRLFSNLDTAVGACTAGRGDVILVAPNYTFSVSGAAALALDVAGIKLVGIGDGSNRPTIQTTATAGTIAVTANNITIENFVIDLTGIDAVVVGIPVSADYFTLRNCQVLMANSTAQAVRGLSAATGSDYVTVEGCTFEGDTSAGMETAIEFVGSSIGHLIKNNFIYGSTGDSRGLIHFQGADSNSAVRNFRIVGNAIWNKTADSLSYGIHSDSNHVTAGLEGFIELNNIRITSDSGDGWIRVHSGGNNLSLFENYGVNLGGERGVIIGAVSST